MVLTVNDLSNDVLCQKEINVIVSAIEDLVFPDPNIFDEKIAALSVHAIKRGVAAEIARQVTHASIGRAKPDTSKLIKDSIRKSGRVVFCKNENVSDTTENFFYTSWFNISEILVELLSSNIAGRAAVFVPPPKGLHQYYVEAGINCKDNGCILIFAYIHSNDEELCLRLNEGLYGLCCVIEKILQNSPSDARPIEIVDAVTAAAIERRVETWFTNGNASINAWRELIKSGQQ